MENYIEVQVKNQGTGFYDQYTALSLPGMLFFLTDTNKFTTDMQPWHTSPVLDSTPVTVLLLPIMFEIPKGKYEMYNLLIPQGLDPFANTSEWILGSVSFKVE